MKPPINLEEAADRVVGRRVNPPDPFALAQPTPADAARWREALGGVRIPRGVHRFKTHEEADAWLWKMITRRRPS